MNSQEVDDYTYINDKVQMYVPKVQLITNRTNQIIGVIGMTGSGKSSLVSYFQNAPMKHQKKGGGKYIVDHGNLEGKYPKIGHDMKSCTFIPGVYQFDSKPIFDLTGWMDTGKSRQELINSYTNSAIFTKGKQVKIVIVAQIPSLITSRGGMFVECVERLAELFEKDLILIKDSLILVLSKVNVLEWDIQTAYNYIKEINQQNQKFTDVTRKIVSTLIESKRILFFPRPDSENFANYIQNIKRQLQKTKATVLTQNSKLTLSKNALNDVNKYITTLNSEVLKLSETVKQQIKLKFTGIKYQKGEQVNKQLNKLRKAQGILKKQIGKFLTIQDESRVLNDLKETLNFTPQISKSITQKLTMVAFYSKFNANVKIGNKLLDNLSLQISQNIGVLQKKRAELTSIEQRQVMQVKYSQQSKKREDAHKKAMQQNKKHQEAIKKEQDEKLAKQQLDFQKLAKQKKQDMEKFQKQITQLANRKSQVVHVHVEGGPPCEIM